MNNLGKSEIVEARKSHTSRAGYVFHEDDTHWQLDKNTKIFVGSVLSLLDEDVKKRF